jgi:hypothetical protein
VPVLPPSGDDSFPPPDTSGFGPGPAPGTGYAVPGQGGGPAAPPARRGNALPIVLGVLAAVLVLCIGGGAAAYFFFVAEESPADGADRPVAATSPSGGGSVAATPAKSPSGTAQPGGGGEEEVSGDLSGYKQGDCLTVDAADDNKVEKAKCTDPGAQKVLLRKNGTLDDSVCESTEATFSLSQDAPGSTKDFVLCVGPVD